MAKVNFRISFPSEAAAGIKEKQNLVFLGECSHLTFYHIFVIIYPVFNPCHRCHKKRRFLILDTTNTPLYWHARCGKEKAGLPASSRSGTENLCLPARYRKAWVIFHAPCGKAWKIHWQSCPSNFKKNGKSPIRSREGLDFPWYVPRKSQACPQSEERHITCSAQATDATAKTCWPQLILNLK